MCFSSYLRCEDLYDDETGEEASWFYLEKLIANLGLDRGGAKKGIYMDEKQVKKILNDIYFRSNGGISSEEARYFAWTIGNTKATLDGEFTADELHAIAWWMRHKSAKKGEI